MTWLSSKNVVPSYNDTDREGLRSWILSDKLKELNYRDNQNAQ